MAKVHAEGKLKVETQLVLNEEETRALCGIASYSNKHVLEAIYKGLGRTYVEPYEDGLCSLLDSARENLEPVVRKLDKFQEEWQK